MGEGARIVWEPRVQRICQAWSDVEWLSVSDGVRQCALVALSQEGLSRACRSGLSVDLSACSLPPTELPDYQGLTFILVGGLADVNRARDAWAAHDDEQLGQLLGYPACCRRFFRQVWVEQRCVDTTWAMAANTATPEGSALTVDGIENQLANILWRWIGVRAVPHLPCRFDCPATLRFGEQMLEVAARAGYVDEAGWAREVLSWPVEWSGLHGIAEIKTPVLKISARTDATARKLTVRWTGTGYPDEGATGLRFPYRAPARKPMAEGRRFRRALEISLGPELTGPELTGPELTGPELTGPELTGPELTGQELTGQAVTGQEVTGLQVTRPRARSEQRIGPPRVAEPAWYYTDNGFSSHQAMDELHRPIVAVAGQILDGAPRQCAGFRLRQRRAAGQDMPTRHRFGPLWGRQPGTAAHPRPRCAPGFCRQLL